MCDDHMHVEYGSSLLTFLTLGLSQTSYLVFVLRLNYGVQPSAMVSHFNHRNITLNRASYETSFPLLVMMFITRTSCCLTCIVMILFRKQGCVLPLMYPTQTKQVFLGTPAVWKIP